MDVGRVNNKLIVPNPPLLVNNTTFFCLSLVFVVYARFMAAWLGVAPRGGPNLVILDALASERDLPVGIITADCSNPHEIDDGLAAVAMPTDKELYRVSAFAVDASPFYTDEDIVRQVIRQTESRYENVGTSMEGYDPMLAQHLIKKRHFVAGQLRDALIISYLIGREQPPSDLSLTFGKVEVVENLRYDDFGQRCSEEDQYKIFGRTAALILHHLARGKVPDPDEAHHEMMQADEHTTFKRGSDINQIHMVGANHAAARINAESELGIYRIHDPTDGRFAEIMSPRLARFSATPGPHTALGLDRYMRVTSSLRRAEDFIMHGLFRAQFEKRPYTGRDRRLVAAAIQKLNQHIASAAFNGTLSLRDEDFWVPPDADSSRGRGSALIR